MEEAMDLDCAKDKFDELCSEWLSIRDQIETEQDTRFKVINRILIDVLGWNYSDIKTEPYTESGYIDYLLQLNGRNKFVIEAKKASKLLIDTRSPNYAAYKIGGPALKSALDGVDQATKYCVKTGVLFYALTTGFEWIGLSAIRTDGKAPEDGKALVFPSLESISKNFAVFYDLFSKEGISGNLHMIRLNEAEGLNIQYYEKLISVIEQSQIKLLPKSTIASDLDNVFKEFFSSMSGDNDPDMLSKCFVESKESREADVSLEKIARNLTNSIEVVKSEKADELKTKIEIAVESQRGEFILIVGNKGAGKTTFIDIFFRLILPRDLKEKCLIGKINVGDSGGDISTVNKWIIERLKIELEAALFKSETPTYDELQGIFYKDYNRWRNGEHKFLYEKDKVEFKIKFGQYLSDIIERNPEKYIISLLKDAVRSRNLMPCIIFDNTDHFPQAFQEQVFQFAQSIYRSVFSFIICPITDRTIWQLSKSGPIQ
jgi:energy-coupling factor transporter ATP-binding protein EcfA2